MTSIVSASVVVPAGRFRGRAVAAGDEDAITLAVEAAEACLDPVDPSDITAVFLATTSRPVPSGSAAALVARMLGLPETARAVDFSGSARCGLSALLAAADSVDAGGGGNILVIGAEVNGGGADARGGGVGDGAAAMVLAAEGGIASFGPRSFVTGTGGARALPAGGDDDAVFGGEGRSAYATVAGSALKRLFLRNRLGAGDFRFALFDTADDRALRLVCLDMRFKDPSRVLSAGGLAAGRCGAATSLMLIAFGLGKSAPGERLLSVACDDGAEAVVLIVAAADESGPPPVRMSTREGREFTFEAMATLDQRRIVGSAAVIEEGHVSAMAGGEGLVCGECGGVYGLPLRVCPSCRTKDAFRRTPLGRKGIVYTMTVERGYSPGGEPVTFVAVNLIGGGRALVPLAECAAGEIRVGDEIELLMRKVGVSPAGPVYHVKARKAGEA